MATKVHMEALSPTMEEGQLVKWLKGEGEEISSGEVLAEIETDKATMELVARGEGTLRKILLEEGGTAPVGTVIAVIASPEEDISEIVAEAAPPPRGSAPSGETSVPEAGTEEGAVASREEAPPSEGSAVPGIRVKASPLARRLADEAELDLSRIEGSGPGGRVIRRDVEAARVSGTAAAPASRRLEGARPLRGSTRDFEDIPLSQMRKTIAKRLVESLGPIPHFFLRINVDMSRILEVRERVNRLLEDRGERISINDFVLKVTAHALVRHPEVNSHWIGEAIRRNFRVHLGVAVAVEEGLITPVVRDADRKGVAQISREVRELAARAREKRLQPEEYTGATFSVSNLGMFGIHEFTGVINPPETGILALGGVEENPAVVDGQVLPRPMMKVTMSCDHRAVDGATGARFLQTLREMLEDPAVALL